MKNRILISMLLLASIMAIETSQSALAATTASQTLIATLAAMKKVSTNGGTINSTIDPDTGNLVTSFTPGFRIETNTTAAQTLDLSATCTGATVQQAIYDRAGTRYIVLANTTVVPTDLAIADCKAATPVDTQNANAISYQVTEPTNIAGLAYVWTAPSKWVATLTKKGKTDTSLTVPSGVAAAGTYSGDDEVGSYVAVVTLAFNP
jgi:hypothetical protein